LASGELQTSALPRSFEKLCNSL